VGSLRTGFVTPLAGSPLSERLEAERSKPSQGAMHASERQRSRRGRVLVAVCLTGLLAWTGAAGIDEAGLPIPDNLNATDTRSPVHNIHVRSAARCTPASLQAGAPDPLPVPEMPRGRRCACARRCGRCSGGCDAPRACRQREEGIMCGGVYTVQAR